jgi:hypothetical protein
MGNAKLRTALGGSIYCAGIIIVCGNAWARVLHHHCRRNKTSRTTSQGQRDQTSADDASFRSLRRLDRCLFFFVGRGYLAFECELQLF